MNHFTMKPAKYLILAVAAIALTSCEDLLDRTPQDRLTPEVFFTNANECELYTNDFYTIFPTGEGIYGEGADIIVKQNLTSEVLGNRTIPATASTWNWSRLRDINYFLQHSYKCTDINVRRRYEGLARFFRAYFYFDKVKYYGDVPWVDTPLDASSSELYRGRDSRQFIVERIIEDLDFAIQYLPAERSVYTVSRWTAMALKSRVTLFEGTYRKYHNLGDYQELLSQCAKVSKTFINESGYTIYKSGATPYLSLFSSLKSNTTEIILSRAYNSSLKLPHDVNGYLTSPTMGRPGMLKDIANMYLLTNGTPFTSQAGWQTMSFIEECKDRDPRLAQTIRTPGYQRVDGLGDPAPNLGACVTGYQLVKYLQASKYDAYNSSTNDLPLFRAAEVYLNYAEALAELGTISQSDLDLSIKPLRSRVGMPALKLDEANANPDPYLADATTGYANVSGPNKGVILEIRRERTVEMPMEGLRYWDIMRWREGKRFLRQFTGMYFPGPGEYDLSGDGKPDVCLFTDAKPSTTASIAYQIGKDIFLTEGNSGCIKLHSDYVRKWDEEKDYLYPVPTDDRVLTQGAISQNPGWNDNLGF